jgi:hypothetical protein
MSTTGPLTNVYYLTPPVVAETANRPPRTLTLRLRLLVFWWRLRLTATDVFAALRRRGRPAEIDTAYLEQRADLFLASPRPPAGPARIIDFAAARQRLRA